MINKLINLANELDQRGLRKEANYIDSLLRKTAGRDSGLEHETYPTALELTGGTGAGAEAEDSMANNARKVSEWVVRGVSILGPDAKTSTDELTSMLSDPDHANTVQTISPTFA